MAVTLVWVQCDNKGAASPLREVAGDGPAEITCFRRMRRHGRMGLSGRIAKTPQGIACGVLLVGPAWWSGGDRLSRILRCSTMGAAVFHVRVRDGIGCIIRAMTTGPPRRTLLGGEV